MSLDSKGNFTISGHIGRLANNIQEYCRDNHEHESQFQTQRAIERMIMSFLLDHGMAQVVRIEKS